MKKINIALDGYSSCGKSTLAKQLANELGYVYVDTGAMYRAITLFAMREDCFEGTNVDSVKLERIISNATVKLQVNEKTGFQETFLNNELVETEIRKMDVSERVSPIATLKFVREILVNMQQEMAQEGGVVMDGRDIGTVVLPTAELKIFMTASPKVRAQRRYDELLLKGENVSLNEVLENLATRDHIDENREESPLRKAEDARILDNSNLSREEQLTLVLGWVREILNKK